MISIKQRPKETEMTLTLDDRSPAAMNSVRRLLCYALAPALGLGLNLAQADMALAGPSYRLESTIPLQSENPDWDYLAFDEAHRRLFVARRGDGAAVVDVERNRLIRTIDRSEDANAVVLVPTLDRGFTINEDGSTTAFNLTTLETIDRVKFGDSADAATFDPATNQLVVAMGDSKALAFVDPTTGTLTHRLAIATDKMESPTPDGYGHLFVALRNEDAIAKIDAGKYAVVTTWKTGPCTQPSGMAYDSRHQRLFAGCRGHGQKPLLAVFDSDSGTIVTTLEIGRGNDGVIYDADLGKIFTSNGVDGNLVVYSQQDADSYALSEATTTRPYARTMAMDHRSKKLYLVTAQGTVDPSRKRNTGPAAFYPNRYYANTFEVLTYAAE